MPSRAFPIATFTWPRLLPGLLASAALAVLASELSRWAPLQAVGLGPLTLALLLGLAAGGLLTGTGWQPGASAGVLFSRLRLLRAGVVLYGLRLTLLFSLSGQTPGFGLFAGATLHEVAQALAVSRALPAATGDAAVVTKMLRVMMLAPFLLVLAAMLPRRDENSGTSSMPALPWFAFGFIAMVLLRSSGWLPAAWLQLSQQLDLALIATAMAALGLATPLALLRRAGPRPLLLAALLFGWLLLGGGLITAGTSALLH